VPQRIRVALVTLAAVLGAGGAVAVGSAPAGATGATTTSPSPSLGSTQTASTGRLKVGVAVLQFATSGRKLSATGQVTATLTDNHGKRTTVRTRVALTAASGGGCRVLHLFLNELTLSLLGLHAHLDKVQLDITGNKKGGVLGSLFCKLAKAKVASARGKAARALNARVRKSGSQALRFTAYLTPQRTASQAAVATCPVLDLVVGPLNLQLLGLVVNLNRVHLSVTATRSQGTLGDTFCQLADNSTTTTTTTTTK
jgi:hypothetical protein